MPSEYTILLIMLVCDVAMGIVVPIEFALHEIRYRRELKGRPLSGSTTVPTRPSLRWPLVVVLCAGLTSTFAFAIYLKRPNPVSESEQPNPLRPKAVKWEATSRLVNASKTSNLSCKIMLVRYQLDYAEEFAADLKRILDAAQWEYQSQLARGDLPKGLSAIAPSTAGIKRQCAEAFQSAIMTSSSNGWPGGVFLNWEGPRPEQTYDPSISALIKTCPNCFQVGIGNPWPK